MKKVRAFLGGLFAPLNVAVLIICIPLIVRHWEVVPMLWRFNRLMFAEALGVFAIVPLAFLAIVALDRRRSRGLGREEMDR